jgi:protein arginine kinase activator
MICQKCHVRQASVHVQQSLNGAISETHLCQQCAHELHPNGFGIGNPFLVAGFLQALLGASAANAMQEIGLKTSKEEGCPTCRTSASRIQNMGKVGCGDCYEHFSAQMDTLLRRIHGQGRHEGKIPKRYETAFREAADLAQLKIKLKHCIDAEAFEEAALLRDRIRDIEIQPEGECSDAQ